MKILTTAKTKVGVVKYPPKLAAEIIEWFNQCFIDYYGTLKFKDKWYKDRFFEPLEKYGKPDAKAGKLKSRVKKFKLDLTGLPESYFGITKTGSKASLKSRVIVCEFTSFVRGGASFTPPNKKSKTDAGRIVYGPSQGASLPVIQKMIDSYHRDVEMTIEFTFSQIDTLVKHELSHVVQVLLLPEEQSKQGKKYGTKEGYALSPAEFGPRLRDAVSSYTFFINRTLKQSAHYEIIHNEPADIEEHIETMDSVYTDDALKQFLLYCIKETKKKPDLISNGWLYNPWADEKEEFFSILKKLKPTAHKKALNYFLKQTTANVKDYMEIVKKHLRKAIDEKRAAARSTKRRVKK